MLRGDSVEKRKYCHLELSAQKMYTPPWNNARATRFRRRMCRGSHGGGDGAPPAGTPPATGRRCCPCCEFDTVRQRLALDSPPRASTTAPTRDVGNKRAVVDAGVGLRGCADAQPLTPACPSKGCSPQTSSALRERWVWAAAERGDGNNYNDGWNQNWANPPQPFALLSPESLDPQSKALMRLAAPSLLNDYYSNLLACSCTGLIALALGSEVYLWNSITRSLVGHVHPGPASALHNRPGRAGGPGVTVSSLSWSGDGRLLSIGTRQGQIQLWDVETLSPVGPLWFYLSAVSALSWKQNILSSGSVLGRIHHHDPRAPGAPVGAAVQLGGVCSLQWSPGGDRLASGSKDGRLSVWGSGDVATGRLPRTPLVTMKQPSAVKAMGWCPWQRHVIATGGGWQDGELRIWDTQSAFCVNSYATNSQICSLLWAEQERALVCGHGRPHHHVSCWPALRPEALEEGRWLTGHTERVLHLGLGPGPSPRLYSAGADECVHVWSLQTPTRVCRPPPGSVN